MNFIITKKCDKNCPYCFAHQARVEDPTSYMTLDQFSRLVDQCHADHIKLLGGEPTQHPNFPEILAILEAKHKSITLISNFLFNEEKLAAIIGLINRGHKIGFLVNSTDLDKYDRMKVFSRNYKTLYNILYAKDREEELSCGITIYDGNDLEYYINYLEFLKNSLPKIERLRISINFPGEDSDKGPEKIIDRTDLGEIMLGCITWCLNNFITPSIDCCYFPCLFSNKEELKIVRKFTQKSHCICGKSGSPSDIFPDETVSFCYPLKDRVSLNFNDYHSASEVNDALITEYQIARSLVQVPEKCLDCQFYKCGMCEGPCLGFYDLKDIQLPNWLDKKKEA